MQRVLDNAQEITIIVKEIVWVKREHRCISPPTTPPNMRTMSPTNHRFVILEESWEFKIMISGTKKLSFHILEQLCEDYLFLYWNFLLK